jgi:hypothetical protein
MSEVRTKTVTEYDYNKTIKNAELNPSYINGLQRISSKYILQLDEEKQAALPSAFEKFNKLLAFDYTDGKQPDVDLNEWESDIYILFSLTQYLKGLAEDQGLTTKTEVEIQLQDIKDIAKAAETGDFPQELADKMVDLASKLKQSS